MTILSRTAALALATTLLGGCFPAPATEADAPGVSEDGLRTDSDRSDQSRAAPKALSGTCKDLDGDGVTDCDGDCDDSDAAVSPGAEETCDFVDNNCDGDIDEGHDQDGDGVTTCGGDCDDDNDCTYPGAHEHCDNQDNDCDGDVDEGYDIDGDGYTECNGDCDDDDAGVNPDAEEQCDDGIDNDCDSLTDTADTAECAACDGEGLGEAGDFNLFVVEDYEGGLDMQGAVAVCSDMTMYDFSINGMGAHSDGLVVGHDLHLARGTVYGDTSVGGVATIAETVDLRGNYTEGSVPVDFEGTTESLLVLSAELAATPATGTTAVADWGGIELTGSEPGLNIFDLSKDDLAAATFFTITAPATSTVVINVDGWVAEANDFAIVLDGIDDTRVLWNFEKTTEMSLTRIGWRGTILAPKASIEFDNGAFDGTIIARYFYGDAEGHDFPFDGDLGDCE